MQTAGAVIGLIGQAYTLGTKLMELYQTLVEARNEIAERITHVQNQWFKTREQLKAIQRIWPSLSIDHQENQIELLRVLISKLAAAKDKLDSLLKKPKQLDASSDTKPAVKRWKYIFLKPYLDDTIKSLDKWQQDYDPSWFLIIRVESSTVGEALKQGDVARAGEGATVLDSAMHIRGAVQGDLDHTDRLDLGRRGMSDAQISMIPYSSAKYRPRPMKNGIAKNGFIINSVQCPLGSSLGDVDHDVHALAAKLHYIDAPTFGVLKCRGVVKVENAYGKMPNDFDMVFDAPTPGTPRTLRSCLVSRTPHTLTERIELAKQLARAVNYVHTLDFVHKNIRPENLIGFGVERLGAFFLIGFEQTRSAEGLTYLRGDVEWQKNLYRHPERQGLNPQARYCMQHDMYSLGVCLLEIGLWESFVLYGQGGSVERANTDVLPSSVEELQRKKPSQVKNLLVELAEHELPAKMGDLYKEVVINCLTCLDEDNLDFGDASEFEQADGVAVGVRYIEKVLSKLSSISV